MTDDVTAALKKAAEVVATEARRLFATWSTKVPDTVKVSARGGSAKVTAGSPEAPAAYFGAKVRNRAPSWGRMKDPWHYTGFHDSLSESAENTLDEAASVFADEIIPKLLDDSLGRE